jgi:hypothetical protein
VLFAPPLSGYELTRRHAGGAAIGLQPGDSPAPGGTLLFRVRADGKLAPVTPAGPPDPQPGDTMVVLGPG